MGGRPPQLLALENATAGRIGEFGGRGLPSARSSADESGRVLEESRSVADAPAFRVDVYARAMDILGRLARELEDPAPHLAHRIRWQRQRRKDPGIAAISHLLPTGGCGVDVGAARGMYSVGMLAATGRHGLVHAFEPNPANAARLRKIARRKRTLVLHQVALSAESGTAEFMVPVVDGVAYEGMGSLEDPSRSVSAELQRFAVPMARLDDVLGDAPRIDMIKIDVEGHEDAVLAGATAVLDKHGPSILIELEHRHRGNDPRPTMDMLVERGLTGWAVFPDGLRPIEAFDPQEHQLRFLDRDHGQIMPPGYVTDFLFTRENVDALRAS